MTVCTLGFLLALLAVSAVFFSLPGHGWRRAVLALGNAAFLALGVPNAGSGAALAVFVLSGYGAARLLQARPSRLLCGAYIAALVGAFAVLNKYTVVAALLPPNTFGHALSVVGLSYMLFRQIHVVVDAMQGQVEGLSLWAYLNYQLNAFTLLAGPIQRFQDFQAYWREPRPLLRSRDALLRAHARVFLGLLKVWVVAALCLVAWEALGEGFQRDPAGLQAGGTLGLRFLAYFYLYPAYVYFNFSGYCDVVIGGAALVGLRLPENFDRPYLARNMIDFWTRWHRTLSFWVRDYVFTPLYKALAEWRPARAPLSGLFCYFFALLLAGVWHGSTPNFLLFGFLHGVGVAAVKVWESWRLERGGRAGLRDYLASGRYRLAAVFLTFHFACATFLFFPENLDRTFETLEGAFTALLASLGA